MDPNANLQEQERIIARANTPNNQLSPTEVDLKRWDDISRLLVLREALFGWRNAGGFDPDWALAPNAARFYGR